MIYTRFGGIIKKFHKALGKGDIETTVDWGDSKERRTISLAELRADGGANEIYNTAEAQLGMDSKELWGEL